MCDRTHIFVSTLHSLQIFKKKINTIKYNQHSCTTQFTDISEFTVFSDSKEGIPTHVHQLLTLYKNVKYKNVK